MKLFHKLKHYFNNNAISYGLSVIPIMLLLGFLYKNSVNTPFWDQWELVPIIENINSGNANFDDFWKQHNEHRLFFPRLVMIGSAVSSNWNLRHEVFISVFIAIISFSLLLLLFSNVSKKIKLSKMKRLPILLPLILSLVWFSLTQQENWLWGWQIQWFLSVLGIVISLFGLSKINKKDIPLKYLYLTIAGAFLAQYSLGNGVLIWPIIILGFILQKVKKTKTAAIFVAGLISTALYYMNYTSPPSPGSKTYLLTQPLEFIKYITVYLGRPLTHNHILDPIFGFLLFAVFIFIVYYTYRYKKQRFLQTIPFVGMGAYAIGSAVVTSISRLSLGLDQAYTSRYTTISSLLLVSVVVLVVFNRDICAQFLKKAYKPIAFVALCILSILLVANYLDGKESAKEKIQYLNDIKSCTSQPVPYEVCLLSTYPDTKKVTPRLEYLKKIHWGGY